MRVLVIASALFAVCASNAIPLIPGDNSHYVSGVSRYFWMPDGDGVPHLVDTQAAIDNSVLNGKNGANNQYYLFTRQNPTSGQILTNGNAISIWLSNYVANRPLVVIVHGWRSNLKSAVNVQITAAVLAVSDANVIVVDWSKLASNINYFSVASGVPDVGNYLGNFLTWLVSTTGTNWNNVHLVGHSLGAHVIGNAGRLTGGRPARITGLDAALPSWENNNNALSTNCGVYVEAIHTDGNLLGLFTAIAHADFYPNGGINPQPGCSMSTCSHSRSYELFASSIRSNHFVGRQCSSISNVASGNCSGSSLNMGNNILTKRGSGIYFLKTGSSWPF